MEIYFDGNEVYHKGGESFGSKRYSNSKIYETKSLLTPLIILYMVGSRLSIHEMFEEQDTRVLALVPDYKINLHLLKINHKNFDSHTTSCGRQIISDKILLTTLQLFE